MITDINKFINDVRSMRETQNSYFKARKNPNVPKEEVWNLYNESKRLEKIVDKQLEECNPAEPQLF